VHRHEFQGKHSQDVRFTVGVNLDMVSTFVFAISQSQEGRGKENLSFITQAQLGVVP